MFSFLKTLQLLNMYTIISSFLQLLMLLSLCSIPTSANPVPGEINRDQFEKDKIYGSCERVGRVFYDDYTVVGHNLQVSEEQLKSVCKGRYRPIDGMYGWTGVEMKLTKWKFEETWENDVQDFVATVCTMGLWRLRS